MFTSLIKEHNAKIQIKKEIQDQRKREAIAATGLLAHNLVDHLNHGVGQIYVNQKKLDTETKILQNNINQFSKQSAQWIKLVEDFKKSMNEIGDVENWSRSIETEMRTISSALEYAYKSSEPQTGQHK